MTIETYPLYELKTKTNFADFENLIMSRILNDHHCVIVCYENDYIVIEDVFFEHNIPVLLRIIAKNLDKFFVKKWTPEPDDDEKQGFTVYELTRKEEFSFETCNQYEFFAIE